MDKDLAISEEEKDPDPAILKRLSEKLHLRTINDLKKESLAIHELVISSDGDPGDVFGKMSSILKKLKDFVQSENPEVETSQGERSTTIKHRSPVIPDDFRCPISLELMRDPVIVSTGQVNTQTECCTVSAFSLLCLFITRLSTFADLREILHSEMVGCRPQNLSKNSAVFTTYSLNTELRFEEPDRFVVREQWC